MTEGVCGNENGVGKDVVCKDIVDLILLKFIKMEIFYKSYHYPKLPDLPSELWTVIFLYDDTYRNYFSEYVVPYLHTHCQIFIMENELSLCLSTSSRLYQPQKPNLYLLVKENYAKLFNDLEHPTFCSTVYFSPIQPKEEYMVYFPKKRILPLPSSSKNIYMFTERISWGHFIEKD